MREFGKFKVGWVNHWKEPDIFSFIEISAISSEILVQGVYSPWFKQTHFVSIIIWGVGFMLAW